MKKTIIVVDDEPDILTTVSMALELEGYIVHTAATGIEAIDKIRCYPPDLAIIDVVLPEISGTEVAHWIKNSKNYKHIPIILITALAQTFEKETFAEEDIECCMIKPFDLNQLEHKVKELLGTPLNARP